MPPYYHINGASLFQMRLETLSIVDLDIGGHNEELWTVPSEGTVVRCLVSFVFLNRSRFSHFFLVPLLFFCFSFSLSLVSTRGGAITGKRPASSLVLGAHLLVTAPPLVQSCYFFINSFFVLCRTCTVRPRAARGCKQLLVFSVFKLLSRLRLSRRFKLLPRV